MLASLRSIVQEVNSARNLPEVLSIIVKEVGAAGYTEYLCCLFKIHITSTNTNFRALIKEERKKWMMGELKAGYKSDGLMPYTLKLCNNQWALGKWDE